MKQFYKIKRLGLYDEIWLKPWWLGFFAVVTSLLMYQIYATVTGMQDYEEGYIPTIFIPAIVAPACSLLIGRYVKQIRKQNQMLAELNATNKKLLSIISHDVRGPLTSLNGIMELYVNGLISNEETSELSLEVSKQVERVLNLLQGILTWANRQEGLQPPELTHFEIRESIESVIDLFEHQRVKKNLKLELGDIKTTAYADQDTFSFVFRNLYQNAIKFTPNGGTISVFSSISDGRCLVSVKDTGVGIEKETLDKILNPNHHYTSQGTDGEFGTGLGLSTSINILRESNSDISVESTPGEGTHFQIRLPAGPES